MKSLKYFVFPSENFLFIQCRHDRLRRYFLKHPYIYRKQQSDFENYLLLLPIGDNVTFLKSLLPILPPYSQERSMRMSASRDWYFPKFLHI